MKNRSAILSFSCLASVAGCWSGSSNGNDHPGVECDAGVVEECTCEDGGAGTRECQYDLGQWTECWCPGGDADSDSDSDSDTDGPGDPACAMLWTGSCVDLINGCASCIDGSVPAPVPADCPDGSWCCAPWQPPVNACEEAGGVCVDAGENEDPACPPGFAPAMAPCGEEEICCSPTAECADG